MLIECKYRNCSNKFLYRPQKMFCSSLCSKYEWNYSSKKKKKEIREKVCFFCEKKFKAKNMAKNELQLYCSKKCGYLGYYKQNKKRIIKKKLEKGKQYYLKNRDKKLFMEKRRKISKNWYRKNKHQHKKLMNLQYKKNKKKFNIRAMSNKNRNLFIKKEKVCNLCSSTENLQIHHKKYTLDFDDWQLLCLKCHKKFHRKI